MDCIVHGVAKSRTRLSDFSFSLDYMYLSQTCLTLKALMRDDSLPTFKMWLLWNMAIVVYIFCCIEFISRWTYVNY